MATVPMIAIGIILSGRATSSAICVAQSRQANAQFVLINPTMKASGVSYASGPFTGGGGFALTDPILFPSGLIDKVSKDKSGGLMGRSFRRHGNQDDDKGDE